MPIARFNPCRPCCKKPCSYTVTFTLGWDGDADLDLYVNRQFGFATCYSGRPSASGLALNHNAHPACAAAPDSPEVITGDFDSDTDGSRLDGLHGSSVFTAWYNRVSECGPPTTPHTMTAVITNTGTTGLWANDFHVRPGQTRTVMTCFAEYAGRGDASATFGYNTTLSVRCASSPNYAVGCLTYFKHLALADGHVDPVIGLQTTGVMMAWDDDAAAWRSMPSSQPVFPNVTDGRFVIDGLTGRLTATCPGTGLSSAYDPTEIESLEPDRPRLTYAGVTDLAGLCGTSGWPYDIRFHSVSPCVADDEAETCVTPCCLNQMPAQWCLAFSPVLGPGPYPVVMTNVSGDNLWQATTVYKGHSYFIRMRLLPFCGFHDPQPWVYNVQKDGATNEDWYRSVNGFATDIGTCPPRRSTASAPVTPGPDGIQPTPSVSTPYYSLSPMQECCNFAAAAGDTLFATFSGGTGGLECLDGLEVELPVDVESSVVFAEIAWTNVVPLPCCVGCWVRVAVYVSFDFCPPNTPIMGVNVAVYGQADPAGPNADFGNAGATTVAVTPAPLLIFQDVSVGPSRGTVPCSPSGGSVTVTVTR